VNQLIWFDTEMRKDPYVLGATLFTASGGYSWRTFDLDPIVPLLGEYAKNLIGK
jgi:hypothetical protein